MLTVVLSLAPAGGDTHLPNREVIVSSGQAHGGHSLRELGRSGQLQQGDVIAHSEYVELGVLENLWGPETQLRLRRRWALLSSRGQAPFLSC